MRILILNFRDLAHPSAGGAEVFTEEVGKRLVDYGEDVTLFTSSFDGSESRTSRNGIRIIRDGGRYGVYSKGRRYVKDHASEFDIIVDEINTVPFNAHKVTRKTPVVALIHQLARRIWFHETWFPLSLVGYAVLEPMWLRGLRNVRAITISNSTKMDLRRLGFRQIDIVHCGISTTPLQSVPKKEPSPTLIFFGRLARSKGPHHAVSAFRIVKRSFPEARLWIVGNGYMREKLPDEGTEGITYFGKIDQSYKFELLRRAHILLAPSVREGWGISVIEANAMGTLAIGYDVPGLRDSIVDGFTGLRVQSNPRSLSDGIMRVLKDSSLETYLDRNALEWSREFTWDRTAKEFHTILESALQK